MLSDTEIFLIELSVFGVFSNTPFSGRYNKLRFTLIMLFLKSISSYFNPHNSPFRSPVNNRIFIISLFCSSFSGRLSSISRSLSSSVSSRYLASFLVTFGGFTRSHGFNKINCQITAVKLRDFISRLLYAYKRDRFG